MPTSIRHLLEFTAIRLFAFLPYSLRRILAGWGSRVWRLLDARHRNAALQNLMRVFPEADKETIDRILDGSYRHFGLLVAEFPEIRGLSPGTVDWYVDWKESLPLLNGLLAEGKGVLLVSGHLGNWEFFATAMAAKGFMTGGIIRPMDNPYLDRYIRTVRESSGIEAWDKSGALARMYAALRDGKGVGILIDQDAGQNGEAVPFFGQPASTYATHVDLSLRMGAPIVVLGMHRIGALRFALDVDRVLRPQGSKSDQAARLLMLEQVNLALERLILRSPDQYLWQHRRWKTDTGRHQSAGCLHGTADSASLRPGEDMVARGGETRSLL